MQPNPHNCLILVSGGARSGKSAFAEALAEEIAVIRNTSAPIAYIATGQIMDPEFEQRIKAHQMRRGEQYLTYEEPLNLKQTLQQVLKSHDIAMLECIPTWLGNVYHQTPSEEIKGRLDQLVTYIQDHCAIRDDDLASDMRGMAQRLLASEISPPPALRPTLVSAAKVLIVVTNETGLGIVPADAASRRYRDDLGWINQRLAAVAKAVFFSVAGIARQIK